MNNIKIGIIGKAGRSKELPENLIRSAKIIGKEVAKNGCILVTGSCMGVSDIAAKAAIKENGIVLGYSPAKDLKEHIEPPISYPKPAKGEISIFTGFGKIGRSVLSITECDGVIIVGGGIGTLNEFSIAWHEGKVIGILEGVAGVIEKILTLEKEFKQGTAKEFKAVTIKDKNPKRLVEKVIKEIKKSEEKPRKEIPITFKNKEGKELVGILHLPEREKSPLAIICHGFQGTKTQKKYISLARKLQGEDIVVFRFDFEGCGDSAGRPKNLTVANEVSDLDAALKAVLNECDVDSKRIAFIGDSLGAVVASLYAEKVNPKTLIFWSPAFNQKALFKLWYTKEDLKTIKKEGVVYKKEKEIGKNYYLENENKDYSNILSKFTFPILIIHGTEDEDVPIEYSQKLAKKFKNITLKALKGANHKIEDIFLQEKAINITSQWLKKYL